MHMGNPGRNILLAALISTVLSSAVASGAGGSSENGGNVIESIEFAGNRKYKDKTLLEKLDFEKAAHLRDEITRLKAEQVG